MKFGNAFDTMTDPQGSLGPPLTSLSVDADEANLSRLRAEIGRSMRDGGADENVIDLVVLAASELATNVIQHTDSPTISVALGRVAEGWGLEVSNADNLGDLEQFTKAPRPNRITGRGLPIVHAVMDHVTLAVVDGATVVRCVKVA